jgi:CubicO group peptidase (beta-lactamase class C family)
VYRHSSGYSDTALTKPTSKDDIYWIFSNTKVMTCIAAMRLVEEGKIALDDKLSKYIPEFEKMFVKN